MAKGFPPKAASKGSKPNPFAAAKAPAGPPVPKGPPMGGAGPAGMPPGYKKGGKVKK